MTVAHLRIYTINKGYLDSWIKLFHGELVPLMEAAGMTIGGSWINENRSQFIWIRSYGPTLDNYPQMGAAYKDSDWWKANVDPARRHIAHMEVVQVESA